MITMYFSPIMLLLFICLGKKKSSTVASPKTKVSKDTDIQVTSEEKEQAVSKPSDLIFDRCENNDVENNAIVESIVKKKLEEPLDSPCSEQTPSECASSGYASSESIASGVTDSSLTLIDALQSESSNVSSPVNGTSEIADSNGSKEGFQHLDGMADKELKSEIFNLLGDLDDLATPSPSKSSVMVNGNEIGDHDAGLSGTPPVRVSEPVSYNNFSYVDVTFPYRDTTVASRSDASSNEGCTKTQHTVINGDIYAVVDKSSKTNKSNSGLSSEPIYDTVDEPGQDIYAQVDKPRKGSYEPLSNSPKNNFLPRLGRRVSEGMPSRKSRTEDDGHFPVLFQGNNRPPPPIPAPYSGTLAGGNVVLCQLFFFRSLSMDGRNFC